jgi:hexosaminidase
MLHLRLILPVLLICLHQLVVPGQTGPSPLIPAPVHFERLEGWAGLRGAEIQAREDERELAELLRDLIHPAGTKGAPSAGRLILSTDSTLHRSPEYYTLDVEPGTIRLVGCTSAGLFRGIQTLRQLADAEGRVPACRIMDHPRFPYRGMHLDVCRHFFPASFVKRYIDLLARYKFNTFHWHLTEDQGWRIEIEAYPRLTQVGAWRKGSQVGPYARQEFDTLRYGGYYTKAEIREVVAYAAARGITVIPEIEMPGHALAALAAYPEYSCSGGPFEVARGWGVFDDVFCPKEETFQFLETILEEVMDLFPSPYIHIGGDECPKTRWKQCPHCQALMAREGLHDEHELQSWFIRRIERFVNSRGRRIIGWDEILEGGLAPNATVMSWRGEEGGIAAARAGHDAIMTPGSHCYFDHYQGEASLEPHAIGGYTPLQKVYAYEPVPQALHARETGHILGAQGNVWTEYMRDSHHVEYMVLPRMIALSEVLWSHEERRNEADFMHRLEQELPRLSRAGYHFSLSHRQLRLRTGPGPEPGTVLVQAIPPQEGQTVVMEWKTPRFEPWMSESDLEHAYVLDTFRPRDHRLLLQGEGRVRAWLEEQPSARGLSNPVSERHFFFNAATGREIKVRPAPLEPYAQGGAFTLVDGIMGSDRRGGTDWLGWRGDAEILLDLGEPRSITSMEVGTYHEPHSWIHRPREIHLEASEDGLQWSSLGRVHVPHSVKFPEQGGRLPFAIWLEQAVMTRHLRISVRANGKISPGNPGEGHQAWLFLDEIQLH